MVYLQKKIVKVNFIMRQKQHAFIHLSRPDGSHPFLSSSDECSSRDILNGSQQDVPPSCWEEIKDPVLK